MNLTASIVTYNNETEIEKVLSSLRDCGMQNLKIFVVDNASSDNTVAIVENYFPQVTVIRSQKNIGFGAGHNLAIRQINSDYHMIINPDITLNGAEINKMIGFMNQNKDTVILTPKILNTDGTEQFLPKRYPSLKYFIGGKFENKGKLFYKWRSEYTLRDRMIKEPISVDFCTGCFMFCRTSALKSVGGFDERYFLHFEDADLTREMQKVGKTMYVPEISVTHEWKRENNSSKAIRKIAIQSMFKYFKKWGLR